MIGIEISGLIFSLVFLNAERRVFAQRPLPSSVIFTNWDN